MKEVTRALAALGLESYADALEKEGWDNIVHLKSLDEAALQKVADDVKMRPGHRASFVSMLRGGCGYGAPLAPVPATTPVIPRPERSLNDIAANHGAVLCSNPPGISISYHDGLIFHDALLNRLTWKQPRDDGVRFAALPETDEVFHWIAQRWNLDPSLYVLEEAFLIDNALLAKNFSSKIYQIEEKRQKNGAVFNAYQDQHAKEGDKEKAQGLKYFRSMNFTNTGLNRVQISAMFHGCTHEVADSLALRGAQDLRRTDGGFFGAGSYFTNMSGYSCAYASGKLTGKESPKNERGQFVVMLCLIATGNTYVISRKTDYDQSDSYDDLSVSTFHCAYPDFHRRNDKALKGGFDSHYIPINTGACNYQCAPSIDLADADECVVKEEAQVYPLARLYFRDQADAIASPFSPLAGEGKGKEGGKGKGKAKGGDASAPAKELYSGPMGSGDGFRINVMNISEDTTEEQLKEMFAAYGTVSASGFYNKEDGKRWKDGFGFVTMSTEEEGKKAMKEMNGKEIGGKKLSVVVAFEMTNAEAMPAGSSGGNASTEKDFSEPSVAEEISEPDVTEVAEVCRAVSNALWEFNNQCPGLKIELKSHYIQSGSFKVADFKGANANVLNNGERCQLKLYGTPVHYAAAFGLGFTSTIASATALSLNCTIGKRTYIVVVSQVNTAGGFRHNRAGIHIRAGVGVEGEGHWNTDDNKITPSGVVRDGVSVWDITRSAMGKGEWESFFEETNDFRVTIFFTNERKSNFMVHFLPKGRVLRAVEAKTSSKK